MRIAHLIYDSPENPWLGGGGAVRCHEINRRLVQQGHRVCVICGGYPGCRDRVVDGVAYYHTRVSPSYLCSRLLYSWDCRRLFRKMRSAEQYDLIIEDFSAFSWAWTWLVADIPRILLVHHVLGEQIREKYPGWAEILRWVEKWSIRRHRYIIAVSSGTGNALKRLHPKGLVEIVYNGVNFMQLAHKPPRNLNRICYVGRIDWVNKGLDRLIAAFALLRSRNPAMQLMIAGSGKDADFLCAQMTDGICYLGRVSEEEKWRILESSGCFCMPSRFEGWGIAAIEAACAGCPVVGTDIPGLNEAVLHGKTGYLTDGSASAIADAIERCLNPVNHRFLSEQARIWGNQWSWDRAAQAQEKFYRHVVEMEHE